MKLRLLGNSMRLRLSQSDLSKLINDGAIWEKSEFTADVAFLYGLEFNTSFEEIQLVFVNNRLKVSLPTGYLETWAKSDEVSIKENLENGMQVLIEKDFQCLKPREGEDESDLFANPLAEKA